MKEKQFHLDYLLDIRDNMDAAQRFVKGLSFEDFLADEKSKYAVVRALEIVGEATKHVPPEIREEYADIPWDDMAGMRDRLIHQYAGVQYDIVWRTVTERIPVLRPMVEAVVQKEELHEAGSRTS